MIDQYISDFIRDAQFRIAELAVDMDGFDSFESKEYLDAEDKMNSLYNFMDVLYIGNWSILGGYNHIDWDDYDIQSECERLRAYTSMVTSPYMTFVGNYPQIVSSITGSSTSDGLPFGGANNFIFYNEAGDPETILFPTSVGNVDGESAADYFSV